MSEETVAELRRKLRAAEMEESEAARIRRAQTLIKRQYTITPYDPTSWHKVSDPSCKLYQLRGEVVNRAEAQVAGHPSFATESGSMLYLFNTLSGKVVTSVSGGTIYIGASDDKAFEEVGAFLVENPDGGDITAIVERHKARRATK